MKVFVTGEDGGKEAEKYDRCKMKRYLSSICEDSDLPAHLCILIRVLDHQKRLKVKLLLSWCLLCRLFELLSYSVGPATANSSSAKGPPGSLSSSWAHGP